VLQEVAYNAGNGSAQFDYSRSGTFVYRSGGASAGAQFTVQWLDAAGKTQPLLAKPDAYLYPRLSPDGQRLAVSAAGDIWIYERQRDTMTRLTFSGGFDPVWSSDGRYIAFQALGSISWTRSDGAGKPPPLTQSKNPQVPYSFTPDDKRLAFHEVRPGTGYDLWTVPVQSDGAGLRAGKPEVFLQTQFNERNPSFSPDGRWLAYASDEAGTYQVYVRAFPDKGGKWQISNNGGQDPVFSRNGRELFFETPDNGTMVAAYTGKSDSFVADKPRVWSEKRIADSGRNGANYDVAPDGKHIVALMPVDTPEAQQAQNHVVFLLNFFDELRRRLPTGK
jgi:serine/threonine-protein kinase